MNLEALTVFIMNFFISRSFVWRKVRLCEASLRGTGEWNNTTEGNKFNPCINNTSIILFVEHAGSVVSVVSDNNGASSWKHGKR